MIRFAHNVQAYTEGLNQASFVASGINYDATLRNLELIGEAATHVPKNVQSQHFTRTEVMTKRRKPDGLPGLVRNRVTD